MNIIFFILVLSSIGLAQQESIGNFLIPKCDWIEQLIPKLASELNNVHHTMIFSLRPVIPEYNELILRISKEYPPIVVRNAQRTKRYWSSRLFQREVTVIVHLMNANSPPEDLQQVAKLKRGHRQPWPKHVIVYFNPNQSSDSIQLIVRDSTRPQKFLDVTLIAISTTPWCLPPTAHYYDPFNDRNHSYYLRQIPQIFPDKFRHANGYRLGVFVDTEIDVRENGSLLNLHDLDSSFIDVFSIAVERLNFSLRKVMLWNQYEPETLTKALADSTLQISLKRQIMSMMTPKKTAQLVPFNCVKLAVVVPVHWRVHSAVSPVSFVIVIAVIIFFITCLTKILKANGSYWRAFNVLQQLTKASSLQSQPRTIIQGIFFCCFGFVSIKCFVDLYSSLYCANTLYGPSHVKSLEELFSTNLRISTSAQINYVLRQPVGLAWSEKFSNRLGIAGGVADCLSIMINGWDRVCLGLADEVNRHRRLGRKGMVDYYDPELMVAVELDLPCIYTAYPMEKNSWYVDKLKATMSRIIEVGFNDYSSRMYKRRHAGQDDFVNKNKESAVTMVLIILLCVGFSCSIVCFMVEFYKLDVALKNKLHSVKRKNPFSNAGS